ncbi:hypothetical protein [Henriciella aquimarina]|uniref:hypothetical protein n=1 Tax=Henriciella aquimarina TaxID=545261 RepID=UPI000A038E79|nr:hypothetical protein [Henriciella aquimarina]
MKGARYVLAIQAMSGGLYTHFELGCGERIEIILDDLESAGDGNPQSFVYAATPEGEGRWQGAGCKAAISRLTERVE